MAKVFRADINNSYRERPFVRGNPDNTPSAMPLDDQRWRRNRRMTRSLTAPGRGPNVPTPSRPIPVPDIPVHPVLSLRSAGLASSETVASVLDAGQPAYTTSCQAAIALAARQMRIGSEHSVLLPAYHCTDMVEPFSALGASPRFYKIREDLSVDLDDLVGKIDASTRAVVVVHYFGFPRSLRDLRRVCDENDLLLLEDCAHSFFGESDGEPLGSQGDYAVASLWKFFPVLNGGCLLSARHQVADTAPARQGVAANLKAAVKIVEAANYYHRLKALQPVVKLLLAAGKVGKPRPSASSAPNLAQGRQEFPSPVQGAAPAPNQVELEMTGVERFLCHHVSWDRIASRRRRRYRQLLSALGQRASCRPLLPELPPEVVPHLFPIWVDRLEDVFPKLEDAALPLQRFGQFLWPGVDESVCRVSSDYSHHLIQLPCHQELRDDEVEWMIERFCSIVSA